MAKSYKKCCVPNCKDRSSKRHRFPKNDRPLFYLWKDKVCNPKFANLQINEIYKSYYVCDRHFAPDMKVPGTQRGIRKDAVPALYLPVSHNNMDRGPDELPVQSDAPASQQDLHNRRDSSFLHHSPDSDNVPTPQEAEECKSQWKHIRDNYSKQKRKLKLATGSPASIRPTKSPLFEHLKFLERAKSERCRIENCDDRNHIEETQVTYSLIDSEDSDFESQTADEIESDPRSPEFVDVNPKRAKLNPKNTHTPRSRSSTPSTSSARTKLLHNLEGCSNQRIQILSQLATQQKEEDDIDLFMRSIALTIKQLPPHLIPQAKKQILTLVSDLQASTDGSQIE